MLRSCCSPLTIITFLATIASFATTTRAELELGKDFIVVAHVDNSGEYAAFPDVARMANGKLVVVFYDGYKHVSEPDQLHPRGGRISCIISDDEGDTWSTPSVVVDTPVDNRDPSIALLTDGRLLCSYFDYPSGDEVQWMRF